jgi:hypothetical protein
MRYKKMRSEKKIAEMQKKYIKNYRKKAPTNKKNKFKSI